jgi:uncharacterized membrane protein HdeD (DUF308 family)
MRTSGEFISPKWLRILQAVVGFVCIGISLPIMVNLAHREISHIGTYSLIFLASIAFIIIGIERVAVGIKLTSLKKSSRIISIGIGVGIIVLFGCGYFFPELFSKLYVLILGLGLLATGALRIIDGTRNKTYKKLPKLFTLTTGILCVVAALVVFMYPILGFVFLLLIVSVIFFITGSQIAFVGITGKKLARISS